MAVLRNSALDRKPVRVESSRANQETETIRGCRVPQKS